jgi:hypothetical protein
MQRCSLQEVPLYPFDPVSLHPVPTGSTGTVAPAHKANQMVSTTRGLDKVRTSVLMQNF